MKNVIVVENLTINLLIVHYSKVFPSDNLRFMLTLALAIKTEKIT